MSTSKCPSCDSPAPHLHPAMQFEGEVEVCRHEFHRRVTPENTPDRIATYPAGIPVQPRPLDEHKLAQQIAKDAGFDPGDETFAKCVGAVMRGRAAEFERGISQERERCAKIADKWHDAYPEDIWLPVSTEELAKAHELMKTMGRSLDALMGFFGRFFATKIAAAIRNPDPTPRFPAKDAICKRCGDKWINHGGEHGPEPCPDGLGIFQARNPDPTEAQ